MRLRAWPRLHACLSTGAVDDIGIVERAPNSSDDDSGDDDDIAEEEEEHDSGKLPPGAAKVRCPLQATSPETLPRLALSLPPLLAQWSQ